MVSDPNHTYAGFLHLAANDLSYDDVINAQRIAVVHPFDRRPTGLWHVDASI